MPRAQNERVGKRAFLVTEAIFHRRVHVLLNYDEAAFQRWVRRQGARDSAPAANAQDFVAFSTQLEGRGRQTEWIICCQHFEWTLADQGTLIHEIVHTIIKIWANNHIPVTADTQEFLAHAVGNLYEDIAARLFRRRGRSRRRRRRT